MFFLSKKFAGTKIGLNFASFLIAKFIVLLFKSKEKMKKIVLSLAVLATVALVSCGKGNAAADSAADTTPAEAPSVPEEVAAPAEETGAAVEAPAEEVKAEEAAAPAK